MFSFFNTSPPFCLCDEEVHYGICVDPLVTSREGMGPAGEGSGRGDREGVALTCPLVTLALLRSLQDWP